MPLLVKIPPCEATSCERITYPQQPVAWNSIAEQHSETYTHPNSTSSAVIAFAISLILFVMPPAPGSLQNAHPLVPIHARVDVRRGEAGPPGFCRGSRQIESECWTMRRRQQMLTACQESQGSTQTNPSHDPRPPLPFLSTCVVGFCSPKIPEGLAANAIEVLGRQSPHVRHTRQNPHRHSICLVNLAHRSKKMSTRTFLLSRIYPALLSTPS